MDVHVVDGSTAVEHESAAEVPSRSVPGAPTDVARVALVMPSRSEIVRARRRLQANALFAAALAIGAYWALVDPGRSVPWRLASAGVLVVALVAMATGVMHDANHGAFSRARRVNLAAGCTLDVLGGSSYLWRRSHNIVHHLNPNVVGVDADIEQGPFARLAAAQPWRWWHRFQHVYMWPLYGFVTLKWFLHSDFAALSAGRIGSHRLPRSERFRVLVKVLVGKTVHLGWAIVLPLWWHPWWGVVAFYLGCSWAAGLILATLFQVAHCVEAAEFTTSDAPRRGRSFAQHQLRTTVNIRCRVPVAGRLARWLMGGLDHQVEHHLAPGLPHTVYPAFAQQVRAFSAEIGATYREYPTLGAAIRGHGRWLKAMGQRPTSAPLPS